MGRVGLKRGIPTGINDCISLIKHHFKRTFSFHPIHKTMKEMSFRNVAGFMNFGMHLFPFTNENLDASLRQVIPHFKSLIEHFW